ncbi:uncharacterized protein LOC110913179 [Helianthus annuus]|uniref:uncharacterized protein LOC110913179 n=1 Tax=Helianthus annuus TaxID=4232 RepID=UPI000B8F9C2B|nr:uncharacterized protein LOC110913179 [Helianthus annuus]
MGVLETITAGNKCSDQDKAKVDVFLHKHIDEMLQFEYSNCEDPCVLWEDLKSRFDHQREVLLPTARDEWNNLRFQDFKKVNEYTSALFRICSTLRFCGQTVMEEDMLEKTFSTFHASNINLQQQYRLQRFQRYSDLNSFLLVTEKNNELLMKNHQARPTGSLAIPEANAIINDDTKDSGRKWGRGRGRGHFGKGNGRNHSFKGNNNFRGNSHGRGCGRGRGRGRGRNQRTPNYHTHKIPIPTSITKGMKLVGPKTMALLVSDVEVRTIGQRLVVHLHIYVNFTKPLSKEKKRKGGEPCG